MENPTTRYGSALIFLIIGVLGSLKLITSDIVGQLSFLALLCLTLFASSLLFFSNRIEALDFKKLTMTLREIRDKEQNVKQIALAVTTLAIYIHDNFMQTEDDESDKEFNRIMSELKALTSKDKR